MSAILNNRSLTAFSPAFVFAAVIFYLSVAKVGIQLPDVGLSPDKLGHFMAYGLLNWLLLRGLKKTGNYSPAKAIKATLAVSLYGAALEFVQWAFFPHRFFEIWDMAANVAGACTSLLIFQSFIHKT